MKEYILSEYDTPFSALENVLGELIRCKDCKHGRKRIKPYMYCDIFGAVTETEWFCSKAERKEECMSS